MDAELLLDRVLDDEGITAGLEEPEAELLIATLGDRVRKLAAEATNEQAARRQVDELCRQARKMSEIVSTFRESGEATARTTAARHGLSWPGHMTSSTGLLRSLLGTS